MYHQYKNDKGRTDILAEKHVRKQKQQLESMGDLDHVERISRNFSDLARKRAIQKGVTLLIVASVPVIAILVYYLIAVIKGP
ncbi:MAG: hypothetical protein JXB38_06560 [Anaerolineales bacterium]|nr:hypothetical protein [Anaerolineales bacterium]